MRPLWIVSKVELCLILNTLKMFKLLSLLRRDRKEVVFSCIYILNEHVHLSYLEGNKLRDRHSVTLFP